MNKEIVFKEFWYLGLFFLLCIGGGCSKYSGEKSDHFDGQNFFNPSGVNKKRPLFGFFRWLFIRRATRAKWPDWVPTQTKRTLPDMTDEQVCVTFINHATVLIRSQGLNILTDPQYSDQASPVTWAGPKRVRAPGIPFEDLPKIHVVLISHDHYDHLDSPTLEKLQQTHDPLFIAGLGNAPLLKSIGLKKVIILDWDQTHELLDGRFTFVKAQHFSGRSLFDRNTTLWGGFVIEILGKKIYFAGDTGYGEHFKETYHKFGKFDFALIPIGSYQPRWFMKTMHVNPEEAVQAHLDLKAEKSMGIHFQTFQMSDEPYDQPIIDLEKARKKHALAPDAFVAPKFGESFWIP